MELADLIRRREVSSTEVVRAYLARIDAINPQLNAVVQVAPDALERARAADEALARGELWGPLHGLPFTAKDNLDTAGLVTAVGLEERRDFIPPEDAVVDRPSQGRGRYSVGQNQRPTHGRRRIVRQPGLRTDEQPV